MKLLESLLVFLTPTIKIPPRHRLLWEQQEQASFSTPAKVYFIFWAITYVAHYYLIDIPLKKEPISLWAQYRFGLAALSTLGLLLCFSKSFQSTRYYKLPVLICGIAFTYMQSRSMIWRAEIPYFYVIVIPIITISAMRSSVLSSLLNYGILLFIQQEAWQARPHEIPYLTSAAIVGGILLSIFRSKMGSEVSYFVSEQEKIDAQSKVIQAQIELNDQIKAFLPKTIYLKIERLVQKERKTILQALDEVLRPKHGFVSCLYSDIRGFTRNSMANVAFVQDSAMPNIKVLTDLVEEKSGVPRLIGDLLFSYFNEPTPAEAFRNSLLCGFEISKKNLELNKRLSQANRIKRNILISFGEGIIGNIGGTDSSREITVLGEPANILSRIDLVIKNPWIFSRLSDDSIVLSTSAAALATKLFRGIDLEPIDLRKMNLEIKDFPNESQIFILKVNAANQLLIQSTTGLNKIEFELAPLTEEAKAA